MPELIIFIGLQASGKTTFYRRMLAGTHEHVSKDNFPKARYPERKQSRLIREALAAGKNVVVDNTNVSKKDRENPIAIAREFDCTVIGYVFESTVELSLQRNQERSDKPSVPRVGLLDAAKRRESPSLTEGFTSLHRVTGGPEEYKIDPYHESEGF